MNSLVEHSKYIKLAPSNYVKWSAWILEYSQYKYPDDLEMVSRKIVNNLLHFQNLICGSV